jgi:hypothetical protein
VLKRALSRLSYVLVPLVTFALVLSAGVDYTAKFTASLVGGLVGGQGTVTLAAPDGTQFLNASVWQGTVSFDDLTSGATNFVYDWGNPTSNNSATLTVTTPITIATGVSVNIAAGDRVEITYTDVDNAPATGQQTATFSTTSDTAPVTASFTLTPELRLRHHDGDQHVQRQTWSRHNGRRDSSRGKGVAGRARG